MSYSLKLYVPEETSLGQRETAERLFRAALEGVLGTPELVWPMFLTHRAIVEQYGENPDDDDLNAQQRLVFDSWQLAEAAAMGAVFGPHRNLDEGGYEITPA